MEWPAALRGCPSGRAGRGVEGGVCLTGMQRPMGCEGKRVRQEWLSGRLLGEERVQLKDKCHGGVEGLGKGLGQRKGALEGPGGGKREPTRVVEDGEGK